MSEINTIIKKISLYCREGYVDIDIDLKKYQKIKCNILQSPILGDNITFLCPREQIIGDISYSNKIRVEFLLKNDYKMTSKGTMSITGQFDVFDPIGSWIVYLKKVRYWDDNPYGIEFIKSHEYHIKMNDQEIAKDTRLVCKVNKYTQLSNDNYIGKEIHIGNHILKYEPVNYIKCHSYEIQNKEITFIRNRMFKHFIFDNINNVKSFKINANVLVKLVINGYTIDIEPSMGICQFDFILNYDKLHMIWINGHRPICDKQNGLNVSQAYECYINFYPLDQVSNENFEEIDVIIEVSINFHV